jgi:SanA protein
MPAMRPRRKPQPESKPAETKPPARSEAVAKMPPPPPPPAPPPPPELYEDEVEEEEERPGLGDRVRREMAWFDGFLRRWLVRLLVLGTHLTIALVACYAIVWVVARGQIYDSVDKTPLRMCGLVLGATPKVDGRDNVFFTGRIQAAADLYHAGRLRFLIVSGDNSKNGYDEPSEMKAALIAKGVAAHHIYCDYAGFRTLDSIVRAHRVFGQEKFTIISQAFHNPRALYIARRHGLVDCVAYNAPGASTGSTFKMHLRELAARVWAILDVELLKSEPKFLGEKVEIGDKHPPVDANPLPRK